MNNNEKRKTNYEKRKMKNEERKTKKEKQTNLTLLSNIEFGWFWLDTDRALPQKSDTCLKALLVLHAQNENICYKCIKNA